MRRQRNSHVVDVPTTNRRVGFASQFAVRSVTANLSTGIARIPAELLPDTVEVRDGSLAVGGCDLVRLAAEFGTPLYVYDEATLRNSARRSLDAFSSLSARVSFAAKACGVLSVLRIMWEEGLDLDVVSAGELQAGLRAGFRASQLHLHGNCKSNEELREAAELGIRAVVVDNREEALRLDAAARSLGCRVRAHVRLQLPLEAETHPHLQTSGRRSKFGVPPEELESLLAETTDSSALTITGLHAHVGSQIGDVTIYGRAAVQLVEIARRLLERGFPCHEVGVGGGWQVAYTPGDAHLLPIDVAEELKIAVGGESRLRPAVEPGRALVARAAIALYRVGSVKRFGTRRVVAVDGGMGDNPRPALYGAAYHALLPERILETSIGTADVVGRYCESGDVLATGVGLPAVAAGDLVCIPVSGAYQLSMASSYNLVPQPAAVLVKGGTPRLIVRRGTMHDLFAREMYPAEKKTDR